VLYVFAAERRNHTLDWRVPGAHYRREKGLAVNLELEISPRVLGRVAAPLEVGFVRALRVEDLELLNSPRPKMDPSLGPIKRLSERHHALARLLGTGIRPSEAAAIVGYHPNRVSILKADPAFQELIAFYRTSADRELRTNFERLSGLTADAADLLQERMQEAPEDVSTGQLIEIVKVAADRSGNAPISTTIQVDVRANLADRLKAARETARKASESSPPVLELEANKVAAE
jgi:hypothetical protein